ncbi:hypothetical protein [Staphylococcus borealis]|nr:hypothetical protein [Staphylococcus borealis]
MNNNDDFMNTVINIVTAVILIAITIFILGVLGMSLYGLWQWVS